MPLKYLLTIPLTTLFFLISCTNAQKKDYTKWEDYLGGLERNQYSTLSQINFDNVRDLEVVWTYEAPDSGQMQMNPIVVDGILYGVTATVQAFALNAETGEELWRFGDPRKLWHSTSRGVAYWESEDGSDKRILHTMGPHLYAIDALTGEAIASFGDNGRISLHTGLPEHGKDKFIVSNTPGTVFENLIYMPMRLDEGATAIAGYLRAFDTRTGELVWTFHNIPLPGEYGYETWSPDAYLNINVGAANNWAGMSVDTEEGILYVPTGSAAPDFWGGDRIGENLFANTLLALDARTGERIWHYQLVHHDLLDRDLPAPPNLLTVTHNGKKIKAVSQTTKQGYVYLFDRYTGEPLFDIEEVPVPPSTLIGEEAWPTQPIPVKPKAFARLSSELGDDDVSPYAPNREELLELFRRSDKRDFAPPSTEPLLLFPGYDGAAEWGGAAAVPDEGIIYVNSNEMAWILQMEEVENEFKPQAFGELAYSNNCAACHGANREGNPQSGYPALLGIDQKYDNTTLGSLIESGKGMMPGFTHLKDEEKSAIISFLNNEETRMSTPDDFDKLAPRYRHMGYNKFLDSNGLPGISPPWGTMTAIDLNSGEFIWQVVLGETDSLRTLGHPQTGTESYGGPVITENGLLFIAGTKDGYFRAYNRFTGELLLEHKLPAPAFATPAIYEVNGKQYIAVACGGEKLNTEYGKQVVAFALPD
ncbi:MAG: PQQ-binding-like beta-propeller repeat protein [Balneolaceae bacterium]|nr:PQQ-binding-like beta-propeller repeat protein [Balneolaceae bacterium]MBO6547282.1 PQQ-binding-like beta-propeller repeat protein [Balneolaceae bacterium]MBO6647771.1 PQQ-binding-like beta-propeller repeat protein [Balneolaceae bacterium]